MSDENPFGDGDALARFLLGTLQLIVFMLAIGLLLMVSYAPQ